MNYCNAIETSKRWKVSVQTVLKYCNLGMIEGAYKEGRSWNIPIDADYPGRSVKPNGFKFIDLFCGIGGFHQAMSQLGGSCVFACDINANCREVYKENFCPNGEFLLYGDINDAINDNVIPQFDVLCGGFPCQTFSKAGLQNGFNIVTKENGESDERGQLFYRIIDILKRHQECKFIVLENVRNLADKVENWNVICKELKEQGFIITERPVIESPHNFGIPQVRERVFILGVRESAFDNRRLLPEGFLTREVLNIDSHKKVIKEKDNALPSILEPSPEKYLVSDDINELLLIWEEFRANVTGLASPFWIHKAGIGIYDREEYYQDPTIDFLSMPEWKKKLVMKSRIMYENNTRFIDDWIKKYDMRSRNMLHQKFEWNCGTDCSSIKDGIIQIRQSGIRVKRPNYFPSLVVMKNTPIVWDKTWEHFRFITPREAAKLQSFSANYKFGNIDSVTYEQLGNSVNVELVRIFAEELFKFGRKN